MAIESTSPRSRRALAAAAPGARAGARAGSATVASALPMRLFTVSMILLGLLVSCGGRATPIPAGAQQVHVTVAEAGIGLRPAAVPAGDVYVVLDTPGSSVNFIQGQSAAADTAGPLSDEALARIVQTGDSQGTGTEGFDDFGCSAEQRAEDLGQMGPCGNVHKVVLSPGKYAFYTGDLTSGPPQSFAVLEVLP